MAANSFFAISSAQRRMLVVKRGFQTTSLLKQISDLHFVKNDELVGNEILS